jgi:hypothetical protein
MKIILRSVFVVGFLLLFYVANLKTENAFKKHNKNALARYQAGIVDTTLYIKEDDYVFSNDMLKDKTGSQPMYLMTFSNLFSIEKVWFTNKELDETIVIQLYTDYHKSEIFHFQNSDAPQNLKDQIELQILRKDKKYYIATAEEKRSGFDGLLKQSQVIAPSYFTSKHGVKLGDSKQKLIAKYGTPDSTKTVNGFEESYWTFTGDMGQVNPKRTVGRKLAYDSFGHSVIAYFKNGKLVGRIMRNEIP